MGRIRDIAEATDDELERYLDHLGWHENPFARAAQLEEYVLPGQEEIADIASHLRSYTGPILIHSKYSGAGKTTLLRVLLDEFSADHRTVYVGEHNVTPYELASIVADELGVGKSNSTKLTEQKLQEHAEKYPDNEAIIGIDEFGLNDPDTLHVVQFLNDLPAFKIILTGMTSQWDAIGGLGSDGRAFQRRVSYQLQLEPFDRDQTTELIQRRIASAADLDAVEPDAVREIDIAPFTEDSLDVVHERSKAVPAVINAACAELITLAAYRYQQASDDTVTAELAEAIDYPEPEVE